jgi:hypothetical protein
MTDGKTEGRGETRSPKSEGRKKAETRNPNQELTLTSEVELPDKLALQRKVPSSDFGFDPYCSIAPRMSSRKSPYSSTALNCGNCCFTLAGARKRKPT